MRCRGSGASVSQRFEGRVCLSTRCRGRGKSVCIGFERWMKHTSRGSGPSVFNGFEGRVRHTLASTFLGHLLGLNPAGVSLFRMHRPLHVLGALKFKPTEAEAAIHAVHCTVNFFFIWVPFRMRCRGSGASVFAVSEALPRVR